MVDHMILHRNEASQVAFESIRSIQVARTGLGAFTLGLLVRSFVRSFVRAWDRFVAESVHAGVLRAWRASS